MRTLWHVALQDLRMHLSEKSSIFFLGLMPLGFVFFFSMINPEEGGPADVRVAMPVVDRDGGFLATALVEELRGQNFDIEVYDSAAADTTEFTTRVVEIPAGFTDTVLAGGEAKVLLTRRPTSNMSYDLAATVRLHQAQVRFLGNLARWAGAADSTVLAAGTSLPKSQLDPAEKGRFFALVAEPSRVSVDARYAGRGRAVPSGMGQSIPGVLVMFVVMTVLIGGSAAITQEKELGTLRRLATAPLSPRQVLLGKTLGLTLLGLAQAGILLVLTEGLVRAGWIEMDFLWTPHLLGLIPLLICYCACTATIGIFLSGIFRTTQQAEGLAWLVGMVLSGIGGAWWPLEIMPAGMRLAGNFMPTAWAMKGLHGLITFGHGPGAVLAPCAVLLAMSVVYWILGSRTLRVTD